MRQSSALLEIDSYGVTWRMGLPSAVSSVGLRLLHMFWGNRFPMPAFCWWLQLGCNAQSQGGGVASAESQRCGNLDFLRIGGIVAPGKVLFLPHALYVLSMPFHIEVWSWKEGKWLFWLKNPKCFRKIVYKRLKFTLSSFLSAGINVMGGLLKETSFQIFTYIDFYFFFIRYVLNF